MGYPCSVVFVGEIRLLADGMLDLDDDHDDQHDDNQYYDDLDDNNVNDVYLNNLNQHDIDDQHVDNVNVNDKYFDDNLNEHNEHHDCELCGVDLHVSMYWRLLDFPRRMQSDSIVHLPDAISAGLFARRLVYISDLHLTGTR